MEILDCGHELVRDKDSLGTGYGVDPDTDRKICYACCGQRDREQMLREGKITLYFVALEEKSWNAAKILNPDLTHVDRYHVTNWPGTLKIVPFGVKTSEGWGWGGSYPVQYFWFIGPDGYEWYGRCAGRHSQVASCKRLKKQTLAYGAGKHWEVTQGVTQ